MGWLKNVRAAADALDRADAAMEKDDEYRRHSGTPFVEDARYHELNDASIAAGQRLRDAVRGKGGR